jgi:hypothetical protein
MRGFANVVFPHADFPQAKLDAKCLTNVDDS